jgi:type IV secretory pathway TrbD component
LILTGYVLSGELGCTLHNGYSNVANIKSEVRKMTEQTKLLMLSEILVVFFVAGFFMARAAENFQWWVGALVGTAAFFVAKIWLSKAR